MSKSAVEFSTLESAPRSGAPVAPASRDQIAIVGIGCRFGALRGPREFWEALAAGRDLVSDEPEARFAAADYLAGTSPGGKTLLSSTAGSLIPGYDRFDAEYFGISPYEAQRMDPHHRLLLETVCDAVRDGGIEGRALSEGRTGVYTVQLTSHYWDELSRAGVWDLHALTGSLQRGNLPARIARALDLHGPAFGVDSTCASSLLAVHLACQTLRLGEIDTAIVGAANLVDGAEEGVIMSQGNLLSASGRCRFGDQDADGYVRSDGVAAVVLKPLRRALADGDRVYGVILGGAATHDGGWTGSFVSPSVAGRRYTLREACAIAGVDPREVDYVEAHGAGTPTGDRTELEALAAEYGAGRTESDRLLVGSVKTNIGHTEATAGLAGLIKAALSLWHRTLPPTLHAPRPTTAVDWENSGLRLARQGHHWPSTGRSPVVGVSAFGISGSNVHLLLSTAPEPAQQPMLELVPGPRRRAVLLPVTAHTPAAVAELAEGYAGQLAETATAGALADICHTAGLRQTHLRFRTAVAGRDAQELAEQLSTRRAGGNPSPALPNPRVVFVFPGHGAQCPGIAAELIRESPLFRQALRRYDEAIRAECGWTATELIESGDPLDDVAKAQPVIWAVECALADVWAHWGVTPDVAVGQSMGEVAAATASGAVSVSDAAAVICRRSALMRTAVGRGALLAVRLTPEEAERFASRSAGRLSVAAVNSPASSVLAGDHEALAEAEGVLTALGRGCRRVNVDVASHSAAMDPLLPELRRQLAGISPAAGTFPIRSTVTVPPEPGLLRGTGMDGEYWVRNLREPVRFADAITALLAEDVPSVFIEMSPNALLSHAIQECVDAVDGRAVVVSALTRSDPGLLGALRALGRAYAAGIDPDWAAVNGPGSFVAPPLYPWQKQRFRAEDAVPTVPSYLIPGQPGGPEARLRPNAEAAEPPVTDRATAALLGAYHAPDLPDLRTSVHPAHPHANSGLDLERSLAIEAAEILGLPVERIERDLPLTAHGMDSLLAMQLRVRAHDALGVRIDHQDVLDGGTLREIARSTIAGRHVEAAAS